MRAVGTETIARPATPTNTWWHDGPKGDLKITYENLFVRSTAVITADLTNNELLNKIIALPTLLRINGVPIANVFARIMDIAGFVRRIACVMEKQARTAPDGKVSRDPAS